MDNLAAKYRPKSLDDVTEQSVMVDIVKKICESDELTNRNFLFIGPAGTGKAQPLDEPVLTTVGFKKMGDIVVGDEVVTHRGNVGKVVGVFPQGTRPIYQITLSDGAAIRVADNHLNLVSYRKYIHDTCYDIEEVVTTDKLVYDCFHDGHPYGIPVANIDLWLNKLSLVDSRRNSDARLISSVKYVGKEECQCIYIDHPDHTYISSDFIPTHNTTTARIIANALNDGKGEPIEIDAASHSGVDSMRNIMAQARVYPVGSIYKVFIIDEVHALSPAAWASALLTIEEQPAMSVFCWCTTNPEKIPSTILSRVQTFQLSKISLEGINNRLKYIIEQENKEGRGITYDEDAILFIAKSANGGMRDAITLLDKALAFSKDITMQSLEKSLGLPNYDDYFSLLNSIAKKDNGKIVEIINSVYNSGVNFAKWFDGFFSFVTNIVKFIYLQDIQQTMIPSIYYDKIKNYSTAHSALCLKLSNKLVKMNNELKTTQYLQELAISYLCTAPVVKKES